MQPIVFQPLYMERVWGGRKLESVYNRKLPSDAKYGESWEISDRENEQSVVVNGNYKGKTLNDLWKNHREKVFGKNMPSCDRFPLLIKILDARSDLSVQVHPPKELAEELGGEPKTEMWYIADMEFNARLYVGLKEGVTKEDFQKAIENGLVERKIAGVYPKKGESIHLNSGRVHAIGAGFLIYEIQQNSDTTYRVFDWNRTDLEGNSRELHVEQSMKCIDFDDFDPDMDTPDGSTLASCDFYVVDEFNLEEDESLSVPHKSMFSIITVVEGSLEDSKQNLYSKGSFFLLPANAKELVAKEGSKILVTQLPKKSKNKSDSKK